jgi:hypothetical protein
MAAAMAAAVGGVSVVTCAVGSGVVGGLETIAEAIVTAVGAATAVPIAAAVGGVSEVTVAVGRATGTLADASCVPVSKSADTAVPIAAAVGGVSVVT